MPFGAHRAVRRGGGLRDAVPAVRPLRRNMIVHAPTGALLWQFREVALLGRHTRVDDLDEPEFARS